MDELDSAKPSLTESDLLDPYEKLVNVEILGKQVQVPEKNRLLRCFQYLSLNSISYGDFCWNGECTNCQIWYHERGQTARNDKPALSCRAEVVEGMVITKLSQFIHLDGISKRGAFPPPNNEHATDDAASSELRITMAPESTE
jgi:hypothetical protein